MKKLFSVFLNLLTFGIPLFLRVLSESHKFKQIMNAKTFVTYLKPDDLSNGHIILSDVKGTVCVTLSIDRVLLVSRDNSIIGGD